MIIKSSARGGATRLAAHLTKQDENEQVLLTGSRYLTVWQDDDNQKSAVHNSLQVIDALSTGSGKKKNLLHVSLNPDQPLSDQEWQHAWGEFEAEFNLKHQQYLEVTHVKNDRLHKHRVYNRIKDNGSEIDIWFNYQRTEKVSRKLEYAFGHEVTAGKHNKAVMTQLRKEGLTDIADWLEQQHVNEKSRPIAEKTHADHQQEKRTNIKIEQVKADLSQAYQATDTGRAFEAAIAEKGYLLAKGDKRDFVIIDPSGTVHSPRRRLGVKAKDLRQRWSDLDPAHMPTVEEAKSILDPDRPLKFDKTGKTREQIKADIIDLKAQAEAALLQLQQVGEDEEASTNLQPPKKHLKQRLFIKHRRARLGKPVRNRRRASRAYLPRTAYHYRKNLWVKRQNLEQPALPEPIDQALQASQGYGNNSVDPLIADDVRRRTAETLLPNVLPSKDESDTDTSTKKGQGDKTVSDPSKDKDQRKDIEAWTQFKKGEGRDSTKPLPQGEATPIPTKYHHVSDETIIPTYRTALGEAGFFEAESTPDPPNHRDGFARIQENSSSKFSMVWQYFVKKTGSYALRSVTRYIAKQAKQRQRDKLEKQQREAAKEKSDQQRVEQLEKRDHRDRTAKEDRFIQQVKKRQASKSQQEHKQKQREELEKLYKDNPHLRLAGRTLTFEQQVKEMHQHYYEQERKEQAEKHFKKLQAKADEIRPRLTVQQQKMLDGRIAGYKFLNDNPDWMAEQHVTEFPQSNTWAKRGIEALNTADYVKDTPQKRLAPSQEYQAELGRMLVQKGEDIIDRETNPQLSIATDKDIAARMYYAGYKENEIRSAIVYTSPNTADMMPEEAHAYVTQQIDAHLQQPDIQKNRDIVQQWKQQHDIPASERRLEQLNLATQRELNAHKGVVSAAESDSKIDSGYD